MLAGVGALAALSSARDSARELLPTRADVPVAGSCSCAPQAAVVVQHELDRNARCSLRLSFCSLTFYCSSEFAS